MVRASPFKVVFAVFFAMFAISAHCQEKFGPADAAAPNKVEKATGTPRGLHVYGDGVNYYDIEEVPQQRPPMPPDSGGTPPAIHEERRRQEESFRNSLEPKRRDELADQLESMRNVERVNNVFNEIDRNRKADFEARHSQFLRDIDKLKSDLLSIAHATAQIANSYSESVMKKVEEHQQSSSKSAENLSNAIRRQMESGLTQVQALRELSESAEQQIESEEKSLIRQYYLSRGEAAHGAVGRLHAAMHSPGALILQELSFSLARESLRAEGELSEEVMNTAVLVGDISLGLTPIVGWSKDLVEAATGHSALTGEKLDAYARGFAIAGVVTGGLATGLKSMGIIVRCIGKGGVQAALRSADTVEEALTHSAKLLGNENTAKVFGPMKKGRLHEIPLDAEIAIDARTVIDPSSASVADTFRSGTYVERIVAEPEIVMRRAPHEKALIEGRYFSDPRPSGKLQYEIDQALLPEFQNTQKFTGYFKLPSGTKIYEGVTGPQLGARSGARMPGGGKQIFLDVPRGKIEEMLLSQDEVLRLKETGVIP